MMDRDVASDSGESIAQSGGDDTTGISASTVAAKIVVFISSIYIKLNP
jgi:hypothetical protein